MVRLNNRRAPPPLRHERARQEERGETHGRESGASWRSVEEEEEGAPLPAGAASKGQRTHGGGVARSGAVGCTGSDTATHTSMQYIYMCMYIRIYVCMYVCMFVYIYTGVCLYMYIYIYI
jgi:hypothetical protein